MDNLPDEILLYISSYLLGDSIYRLSCVSWRLYHLLNDGVNIRYIHCLKDEARNELFFSISDGKDQDLEMDVSGIEPRTISLGKSMLAVAEKTKKLKITSDYRYFGSLSSDDLFLRAKGKYYADWRKLIPLPVARYKREIWEPGIDMKTRFEDPSHYTFTCRGEYSYIVPHTAEIIVNFEVVTPLSQFLVYSNYEESTEQLMCQRQHLKKGDMIWPFKDYGYHILGLWGRVKVIMIPEVDKHLTPLVYCYYLFAHRGLIDKLKETRRYVVGMNGNKIVQWGP